MQTIFRVIKNGNSWVHINYDSERELQNVLSREHNIKIGNNFQTDDIYGIYLEDNINIGNNVRLKNNSQSERPRIHIGSGSVIGDECTIFQDVSIGENVIIGDGVIINPNCKIDDNVSIECYTNIGIACKIEAGSTIGRVVNIDSGCLITGSNISNFCTIKGNVKIFNSTIDKGAYIGGYSTINNLSHIHENVIIGSSLKLPEFSEIKTSLCVTLSNGKKLFWNPITGLQIGNRTESIEWWINNIDQRLPHLDNANILEVRRFINAVKHFQDTKIN